MLRVAGRRLSSLGWRPAPAASSSSFFGSSHGDRSSEETISPVGSPISRLIGSGFIGSTRGRISSLSNFRFHFILKQRERKRAIEIFGVIIREKGTTFEENTGKPLD